MGAYILTRLASQRPAAFRHLVLIDPVIMDPAFYEGEAAKPIPDPAGHPVARRRNVWTDVEEMRARFADRPPYAHWDPQVLADYRSEARRVGKECFSTFRLSGSQ